MGALAAVSVIPGMRNLPQEVVILPNPAFNVGLAIAQKLMDRVELLGAITDHVTSPPSCSILACWIFHRCLRVILFHICGAYDSALRRTRRMLWLRFCKALVNRKCGMSRPTFCPRMRPFAHSSPRFWGFGVSPPHEVVDDDTAAPDC